MVAAVGLVSLPGSSVAAWRISLVVGSVASCSRSWVGAVTSSALMALMVWVRALTALWRATRSARSISTVPSWALGVPLAAPAAGGPVGAVDLQDPLPVRGQEAGQSGAVAAGAFHTPGLDLAERAGPAQQLGVAGAGGLDLGGGQPPAELVSGRGNMQVLVGVDPDGDAWRLGICHGGRAILSIRRDGWSHRPGGRTALRRVWWQQAPIRSRVSGWCRWCGHGAGPTDLTAGTRPVVVGVRPTPQPHQHIARARLGRRIVQQAQGQWEPESDLTKTAQRTARRPQLELTDLTSGTKPVVIGVKPLRYDRHTKIIAVGTIRGVAPPFRQPAGRRAGPSPTDDVRMGRRPRSSPSTREACAWRRGPASPQPKTWKTRRPGGMSPVNTAELADAVCKAERRVLEIQTKLHRWARDDPHRRFDDLFNLVADPGFLLVAWDRVRGNKGAKTAGVDGRTVRSISWTIGVEDFLDRLRSQLKDSSFTPLPVRERMIPKQGGKQRRLGIATVTDRVVQASLKLVLEPIFEADFLPCSYGFRPNRRAHDAVA